MGDGLVDVIEVENCYHGTVEAEQTGAHHCDHANARLARIHPLATERDVVPHDPGIRQFKAGTTLATDSAHQHHAAVRPHRHHGCPHNRCRDAWRQDVEHTVDRAWCGALHTLAIVILAAAQPNRANTRAVAANEPGEHLFIATSRDHTSRTHRQCNRHRRTAEVASSTADQHRLSGL